MRSTNQTTTKPTIDKARPGRSRRAVAVRAIVALAIGGLVLSACSRGDGVPLAEGDVETQPASPSEDSNSDGDEVAEDANDGSDDGTTEPVASNAPAGIAASIGAAGPLGEILVGPNGLTLYGFTNDAQAASTCYGTCADAWPPVLVDRDFILAPALDEGIFATTTREDGSHQLVAGKWPLYYFAGDVVPGDAKGQGSGDVWFVVTTAGSLVTDGGPVNGIGAVAPESTDAADADGSDSDNAEAAGTAGVTTATTKLGEALVDGDGLTLYGFTDDVDGQPTCNDGCAEAWPPVIVDSAEVPAGLDPELFTVAERADGSFQLRAGDWPLYRFAGDKAPGDVNGQESGDKWFVIRPDGSLINPADLLTGGY